MDLIKYEGSYVGKELLDSLGTMVTVTYIPYENRICIDISDSMYNGTVVSLNRIPKGTAEIIGLEFHGELNTGDVIALTPPGGFDRLIHIHLEQGA